MKSKAYDKFEATFNRKDLSRRRTLKLMAGTTAALALPSAFAQNTANKLPTVSQIADVSNLQRDVSKDFLAGSRTAWQEINDAGGIRGQFIRHQIIEIDGSGGAGQAVTAFNQLSLDDSCIASFGTCGDMLASEVASATAAQRGRLAHLAPWLQSASLELGRGTFPIFSNRADQIEHVLRRMSTSGSAPLVVVYQDEQARRQHQPDLMRLAQSMKITIQEQAVAADLSLQAQQLSRTNVPLVLFIGGTPELVQFTRGWRHSNAHRYVIALADVNLQTARDMGSNKIISIIGTQAVPVLNGALPVVRRFRTALAKYYEEQPTALSFAGYLSARFTAQMLQSARALNRLAIMEAMERTITVDLGGFRVDLQGNKLLNAYVTQTMLGPDGRVVG